MSFSAPCLQALGTSIWFQMTSSSCGSIYKSIGKTKLMFRSGSIFVPIQILLIVLGVMSKDIITMSWCISCSFVFKFFIEYYFLIGKGMEKSVYKFLCIIKSEVVLTLILTVTMFLVPNTIEFGIFTSFIIKLIICSGVYIVFLIFSKQYKYFIVILPNKIISKFRIKDNDLKYEL